MNLLVTGAPGVGKTTVVRKVSEQLARDGWRVGGIITAELRKEGRRVGFQIGPVDGPARTMAHESFISRHRVGRYGVDVEVIDYVVDTTLRGLEADVVIIDEIGAMECLSRRFATVVTGLLDGPIPVVATVALQGSGLIDDVKHRADCELVVVSPDNRERSPAHIVERLGSRR